MGYPKYIFDELVANKSGACLLTTGAIAMDTALPSRRKRGTEDYSIPTGGGKQKKVNQNY